MLLIKAFWVSLPLLIMMAFLALGIYGLPALQVSTQKIVKVYEGN